MYRRFYSPSATVWTSRGHRRRPFPPPRYVLPFVSHIALSVPTSRRLASNVANSPTRIFGEGKSLRKKSRAKIKCAPPEVRTPPQPSAKMPVYRRPVVKLVNKRQLLCSISDSVGCWPRATAEARYLALTRPLHLGTCVIHHDCYMLRKTDYRRVCYRLEVRVAASVAKHNPSMEACVSSITSTPCYCTRIIVDYVVCRSVTY